jgi:hypothetical protein
VLQLLVESDSNARAWLAVEHLQPELGRVVTSIRKMIASDERIQAGHSVGVHQPWSRALRSIDRSVPGSRLNLRCLRQTAGRAHSPLPERSYSSSYTE